MLFFFFFSDNSIETQGRQDKKMVCLEAGPSAPNYREAQPSAEKLYSAVDRIDCLFSTARQWRAAAQSSAPQW